MSGEVLSDGRASLSPRARRQDHFKGGLNAAIKRTDVPVGSSFRDSTWPIPVGPSSVIGDTITFRRRA
jgi:hypothetical protein